MITSTSLRIGLASTHAMTAMTAPMPPATRPGWRRSGQKSHRRGPPSPASGTAPAGCGHEDDQVVFRGRPDLVERSVRSPEDLDGTRRSRRLLDERGGQGGCCADLRRCSTGRRWRRGALAALEGPAGGASRPAPGVAGVPPSLGHRRGVAVTIRVDQCSPIVRMLDPLRHWRRPSALRGTGGHRRPLPARGGGAPDRARRGRRGACPSAPRRPGRRR